MYRVACVLSNASVFPSFEKVSANVAVTGNLINVHTHTHTQAGGGAQGTLSLSKNCTSRESVSPLSRLIRGFRNKYH